MAAPTVGAATGQGFGFVCLVVKAKGRSLSIYHYSCLPSTDPYKLYLICGYIKLNLILSKAPMSMEETVPDEIKDVIKRKGTVYVCFDLTENIK